LGGGFAAHAQQYNPSWWTNPNSLVLVPGQAQKNFAVANLGQLKWIATCAKAHLDAVLPGGAGTEVNDLVATFKPQAGVSYTQAEIDQMHKDNYSAVNLGQAKAVAKVFYDRLLAAGYDTRQNLIANGYPSNWQENYPWISSTPVAENYKLVNLGQLKLMFSFDIVDSNGNGILDYQEGIYPAASSTRDTDGDGVPDAQDPAPNDPSIPAAPPPPGPGTTASLIETLPPSPFGTASGFAAIRTDSGAYSNSAWASGYNENRVFQALLHHTQSQVPERSWDLRVGLGGQIYSLASNFGELIPPQRREAADGTQTNVSPWNDEVFELVAVNTTAKTAADPFFIHGAGPYISGQPPKDPFKYDTTLNVPWYSPRLAWGRRNDAVEPNAFVSVNWAQQAHLPTKWKSNLIVYTQYKDCDSGIIEVTYYIYAFGTDPVGTLNWFNAPWGAVRRTSLRNLYLTNPSGSLRQSPVADDQQFAQEMNYFWEGHTNDAGSPNDNTTTVGGWALFASGLNSADRSLALVYGTDPNSVASGSRSVIHYGYTEYPYPANATETNWRNSTAFTGIRKISVPPGTGMWFRYYLVVGGVNAVSNVVSNTALVSKASCGALIYTEDDSGTNSNITIPYYATTDASGRKVLTTSRSGNAVCMLYARPVANSVPLFRLKSSVGVEYVSCNPYALSGPNGDGGTYPTVTGTRKDGTSYTVQPYRPYDGKTTSWELLGYALPAGQTNKVAGKTFTYNSLPTLLSQAGFASDYYVPNGVDVQVRVP
jgi:hypothetical protein